MIDLDFQTLEDISDIAIRLGCSRLVINSVIHLPSLFYIQERIPKKGKRRRGQYRIVYNVRPALDSLQKNLATVINSKISFPEYVQGFVSKRSIASNASLHLAKKYVLSFDIKDFFDSITDEQVREVFKFLGCKEKIANIFAQLCTLNGHLVQGASTSPILANLVCIELDKTLAKLANEYCCSFSRYADDITFSGDSIPRKKEIEKCLKQYGFQLNQEKYKSQPRGGSQYVTGLTVFDDKIPRIPKYIKRKLRQELYYISKYGLERHLDKIGLKDENIRKEVCRIDGWIAFMYSVEPQRALQFDIEWQTIIKSDNFLEYKRLVSPRDPHKIIKRRLDI